MQWQSQLERLRQRHTEGPGIFDPRRARTAQGLLSRRVVEEYPRSKVISVCGMDVSYRPDGRRGAGTAVVMSYPEMEVVEVRTVHGEAAVPYIPSFLAFREMPYFARLMWRVSSRPSVFMIHGHGRCHPMRLGSASHFGVVFDVPTIGVASRPLGRGEAAGSGMCGEGSGREDVLSGGEPVARVLREGAKGIYVSVGHRISLDLAEEVTRRCLRDHRMPEPLFLADKISRDAVRGVADEHK